jgi:CopG family transcriptional regulator / antitoxin EndoAI
MQKQTRTTSVVSLSLPPALLRDAMRWAKKEGRTKSELFREALRYYIQDKGWLELQQYAQKQAKKLGITPDDIPNIVQEYRNEKRKN